MSTEMTCLKCGAKKSGSVGDVLEWDKVHRVLCPDPEPEWEKETPRGFGYTRFEFRDYESEPLRAFSIQRSSLATEHKVWIGADPNRAHLNVEEATRVRDALSAFLAAVKQEGEVE